MLFLYGSFDKIDMGAGRFRNKTPQNMAKNIDNAALW
jgi:hypothetical protein